MSLRLLFCHCVSHRALVILGEGKMESKQSTNLVISVFPSLNYAKNIWTDYNLKNKK